MQADTIILAGGYTITNFFSDISLIEQHNLWHLRERYAFLQQHYSQFEVNARRKLEQDIKKSKDKVYLNLNEIEEPTKSHQPLKRQVISINME